MPGRACPVCDSRDQLQLVSAYVAGATSTTARYRNPIDSGPLWLGGEPVRTQLASQLALPDRPEIREKSYLWEHTFPGIALGIAVGLLVGGLAVVSSPTFALFGFLIPVIAGVAYARSEIAEEVRSIERARAELIEWRKLKAVWDLLYVCLRDGIVIRDDTGEHSPVSQMESLIED